jgi:hypothetical protein
MEAEAMAVPQAFRDARRSTRLTQAQLGALLRVEARAVSRWEIGRSRVPRPRRPPLVELVHPVDSSAAASLAGAFAHADPRWARQGAIALAASPPSPPPPSDARAVVKGAVREAEGHTDVVVAGRVQEALVLFLGRVAVAQVGMDRVVGLLGGGR